MWVIRPIKELTFVKIFVMLYGFQQNGMPFCFILCLLFIIYYMWKTQYSRVPLHYVLMLYLLYFRRRNFDEWEFPWNFMFHRKKLSWMSFFDSFREHKLLWIHNIIEHLWPTVISQTMKFLFFLWNMTKMTIIAYFVKMLLKKANCKTNFSSKDKIFPNYQF